MAKVKVKQAFATFLKGILAGVAIALGSALFLVVYDLAGKFAAGLVFPVGMLLVLNLGYFLYTGKVCFLFNHLKKGPNLHYSLQLLFGLLGNLVGAMIIGFVLNFALGRMGLLNSTYTMKTLLDFGQNIVANKLDNDLGKVFVLAILCNILIYFCVEGFAKVEHPFVKHLIVFLTIGAFNILGFEHAIADMFYITFAGVFSLDAFLFMLVVIAGNTVGGLIIPLVIKLIKFLEKR